MRNTLRADSLAEAQKQRGEGELEPKCLYIYMYIYMDLYLLFFRNVLYNEYEKLGPHVSVLKFHVQVSGNPSAEFSQT